MCPQWAASCCVTGTVGFHLNRKQLTPSPIPQWWTTLAAFGERKVSWSLKLAAITLKASVSNSFCIIKLFFREIVEIEHFAFNTGCHLARMSKLLRGRGVVWEEQTLRVRFLCGSLCSHMLDYFICFYLLRSIQVKLQCGTLMEVYTWRAFYRPFALRGHVTPFLWKWKLYDFAFEKWLVGSDLVFQTYTIFLKWVSS